MKIQLKLNGEWAVLPPGFALKMIRTSPLFSDQGDFSFPFELPVEPNRHIFGPIADPMGFVRLREFHALPAEIWFDGNQVFVGQTEISGEQTFSQRGKVSFNVVSNNGAFRDMIANLNCRDVRLKDDIKLGWRPARLTWTGFDYAITGYFLKPGVTLEMANADESESYTEKMAKYLETRTISTNLSNELELYLPEMLYHTSEINVDTPYPAKAYCNVRMCCANTRDETLQGESSTGGYGYRLYEPDSENRAPSFFVLYFLDCLFCDKTLDVSFDNRQVLGVEDLRRLAFLNAYPRFDDRKHEGIVTHTNFLQQAEDGNYYYTLSATLSLYIEYETYGVTPEGAETEGAYESWPARVYAIKNKYPGKNETFDWRTKATVEIYDCYANGDNFPDTNVSDVISDLTNGFGIVFDYDQQTNFMQLHLVRDIMRSTEVDTPSCTILAEPTITRTAKNGQILSYGNSDDPNFNYAMPKGKYRDGSDDPVIINSFLSLSSIDRNRADAHTYYDVSTGYAYRLRVDKTTGNEPQFFPVGTKRDYKIGICKENRYRNHLVFDEKDELDTSDTRVRADRDESNADRTDLKFRPVKVNDVWSWYYNEGPGYEGYPAKKRPGVDVYDYPQSAADQMLCTFVDCEAFNNSITVDTYEVVKGEGSIAVSTEPKGTFTGLGSRGEMLKLEKPKLSADASHTSFRVVATGTVTIVRDNAFDITNDQHPLAGANVGYQLGIMRGPGNKSNVEIGYNYDDEGNDTWYNVVNSPTFTADSIDPYGNVFDYNGEDPGGATLDGRLSLLLDARKVREYDKDGNPVYFDMTDNTIARRGLVPQLLEDFLYFKAHHVKVTFSVLMTLSAINNLQLLKWNRFGDYIGLIRQVNYELTESGLQNATIELLVANK